MQKQTLFNFMQAVIIQLKQVGRQRTSETYCSTLRSFRQFRHGKDILLKDINSNLLMLYEAYLRGRGLTKNSTSFYIRILRAVYNRAVENSLIINQNPFKHVYTGIDKTVKRAISLGEIKKINGLNLSARPSLEFARDIFMFSFYTRGCCLLILHTQKKKDLSGGILSYRRRKTGQQLLICWEECMQNIIDKYSNTQSEYLLPIIKPNGINERRQYQNAMCSINRSLKDIGKIANLAVPLTVYVARHSWARAAKSKCIPISVISEGMGHNSERNTQIYLASLDTSVVDKANLMILESLI